jgi:hypothetical protein
MMFLATVIACILLNKANKPYEDLENNALEELVLLALALMAFSGVVFYAPTANPVRTIPSHFVAFAQLVDIVFITCIAAIVIVVTLISMAMVLWEEQNKLCPANVGENRALLEPIFRGDVVDMLFDVSQSDLRNECPKAAFTATLVRHDDFQVDFETLTLIPRQQTQATIAMPLALSG